MNITRADFLKKIIQAVLATLLIVVSLVLSRRVVIGNKCNGCPGDGICRGESDCNNFLAGKR